jgi:hypothetical protein
LRKRQFLRQKLAKIAENCDPWTHTNIFKTTPDGKLSKMAEQEMVTPFHSQYLRIELMLSL